MQTEAITTPSTPAASASTRLSASNWRTICQRVAPSAARTAISRDRAVARASIRFATFAQAMSRTSPTAPIRTSSVVRTGATSCSRSGVAAEALVRVAVRIGVGQLRGPAPRAGRSPPRR